MTLVDTPVRSAAWIGLAVALLPPLLMIVVLICGANNVHGLAPVAFLLAGPGLLIAAIATGEIMASWALAFVINWLLYGLITYGLLRGIRWYQEVSGDEF